MSNKEFIETAKTAETADKDEPIATPTLWRDDGWTAEVIKNEDDDGWAVAMTLDGQSEPALVGPWTMGRDKKNPKPLDSSAFFTLVKTASEVLRRHEQQLASQLHKTIEVEHLGSRITVKLDIEPDEDNPTATLSAFNESGDELGSASAPPSFNLTRSRAIAFIESGYTRPKS